MKTVIVTGASTGIGKATALEFAKNGGGTILLIARNEQKLNKVKEEIEKLDGTAEVFVADLKDFFAQNKFEEATWGAVKKSMLDDPAVVNGSRGEILKKVLEQ